MTFANLKLTAAAAIIAVMGAPAMADNGSEIARTYVWTAHEGQEERLVATYSAVGEMLQANEPGLISYEIAVSETGNQIVIHDRSHISTRQYGRLVRAWGTAIGLEPSGYGTHSLRRTKAAEIYRKTGNLRAVQLLLGHTRVDSTVRYLGVELEDALSIVERIDI